MLTVGNVHRRTGGYLYHVQVYPLLRELGVYIDEIILSAADVISQRTAAVTIRPQDYDAIMVDALARTAVAQYIDNWRTHCPVVAMVHELPSVATGVDAADEAPLLRADALIAVSPDGRQRLCDRGVNAQRIIIASPGCDRLGTPPMHAPVLPPQLLCVAQWIYRKGLDTLIAAWQQVAHPTAVLHMYGERDVDLAYTTHIDALITSAHQAGAQIVVHGSVIDAEIIKAYQHATLFVLPSRFEGYGMVFAEALWAGVPVVACDAGPLAQLVGDGGVTVPVDDVDALATQLTNLLNQSDHLSMLAQAAHTRGQQLPRWRDTAQAWQTAIQMAIQMRR
ncbi:MAG: glycosyltransferase family 4 protein [Roseiflexaceae bacterium]